MADFIYPTSAELNEIAQDLVPRLEADRPIFQILPTKNDDAALLMWDQLDNFIGLQQVRGMGGEPPRVKKVGIKRYLMQPGVYGEFIDIDETELLLRRQIGTFNVPINISDLIRIRQDQLLQRRLDRIEQIGWTLLTTGTFSVAGPNGAIMHTDSFTTQTFSAANAWSNAAASTPLADFRSVKILGRGHSVDFGPSAVGYMNQTTANRMLINTNTADIYGRRQEGLATINNLRDVNRLLAGDDLPQIEVYDRGYIDDSGTFQLYIPTGVVVVVGKRPGNQALGNYVMTRNASNPDMSPGAYMRVVDNGAEGSNKPVPRRIDVHDGHNGGPVLYYPSGFVVMNV